MEQPLISIILPVYGVEKYLDPCIESLVKQTYQNIEIIPVDDGSKDRCPEIIDAWARRDARVRAVHKENGGQSSARNMGMDLAAGQYIAFVDSDDWVEPDYCEKLYRAAELYDSDIAVGFFTRDNKGKEYPTQFFIPSESMYYPCSVDQAVRHFLENAPSVWGKLYKADVLKTVRFPEGRLAEEYGFQLKALMNSKTIGFCNRHLYHYRIRSDSDAHSIKPKYLLDNIQALDEAYGICSEYFNFETEFCRRRLASLIYEFTAAESFGQEVAARYPSVLEHALNTVNGNLLDYIESPLAIIFYTFVQFYPFLNQNEKKRLQKDYRKKFSCFYISKYHGQFILKFLPAYFSLALARKLSGWKFLRRTV